MAYEKKSTELVVLGAGPGGYAAAFRAADMGIETTLVDVEKNPGGVCLYRGCIPSKALLHVAHVIHQGREATNWGVTFGKPKIDPVKTVEWKNQVVAKLTGGLGQLVGQRKISYIQGRGSFKDSHMLKIFKQGGGELHLSFQKCILATGSRPASFPHAPLDSPLVMNSTEALELSKIPKKMLVVGGGYIGLELGSVYAALGCEITLIEMTAGYLPGVDRDLITPLSKKLDSLFSSILFGTKVTSIKEVSGKLEVSFNEGEKEVSEVYDRVLIAVGRSPNTSGLGLEAAKIELDEKGFIPVNPARQTVEPDIYAIGDITGEPLLAHKATHEAFVAVGSLAGEKISFEPRAIPAVVFTDPEIAWCGLTEVAAQKAGKEIKVARFPWGASGRAITLDRPDGLTKLIIDPENETILGMGICGTGAGELIAEGVVAIEMGATASDLKMCIHPHPTLSETVMESAEVFFGQSTHLYRPKR